MERPRSGRLAAAIIGVSLGWLASHPLGGHSTARGGVEASDVRSILRRAVRAAEEIEPSPLRGDWLAPIAEAQADAGDRMSARATLEKALDAIDGAQGVDPVEKAAKLAAIARSLAAIGSRDAALETVRRAAAMVVASQPEDGDGGRSVALARCAAVQASAGDGDSARETFRQAARAAEAIKDRESRWMSLLECERAALGVKERPAARAILDDALRAARAVEDGDGRSLALEEVAGRLAEAGDFDEALRVLAELPRVRSAFAPGTLGHLIGALKGSDRATVGRVVGKVLLIVDDLDGARDQAEALGAVAEALAELGEIDEARAIADDLGARAVDRMRGGGRFGRSQIRWHRAEVLASIALARAGRGDRDEIEETVREVLRLGPAPAHLALLRDSAIDRLARARARAGDAQGARDLAKLLDDEAAPIAIFLAIAEAQATAGDGRGAVATLRQAFEATAEHARTVGPDRKPALEAKYPEIARAQAKAGDYEGAIRTSAAMGEEDPAVIEAIARAWAKAGDANVAASWASGRATAPLRASGLLGVAEEVIAGRGVARGGAADEDAGPSP